MYPGKYAAADPGRIAARLAGTAEVLTYGELEERSVRLAHVLHDAGLRRGDVLALLTDNDLRAFEVYWAAMRSGLYLTAINHHLSAAEVGYILEDSGAAAVVAAASLQPLAATVATAGPAGLRLAFGGSVEGYASYDQALAAASPVPFADQPQGAPMLYSSGTTGRPKGVRLALPAVQVDQIGFAVVRNVSDIFGVTEASVYLSPAPIYHAAPLRWSGAVQAYGATVVMMRRFDAEQALAMIEAHRVTHAQFVPTMFVRMLQLPAAVRGRYDLSSLQVAVHAAAPCPVEVKQKMIGWWGPILAEYYAGTESNGMTAIDSAQWLAKPGSVGRPARGPVHICGENGTVLPAGRIGLVYFEADGVPFSYHNDPAKTRDAQHPEHPDWSTLGDIGYLDDDGYLFLTDRRAFVIISGGVNIYPQEIENVLALHPAVYDVAVIGVPDAEMGESVAAFIQPAPGARPGPELEREIIAFVKSRIASFKAPRSVRFVDTLPRTETGKLAKGKLRQGLSQQPAEQPRRSRPGGPRRPDN